MILHCAGTAGGPSAGERDFQDVDGDPDKGEALAPAHEERKIDGEERKERVTVP